MLLRSIAVIAVPGILRFVKFTLLLKSIADRFETIATAIAASYMNIPLVHTQGGEITGSIDESVRHAITRLSNLHFPSTLKSMKNLIKMGEDKKMIFLAGCPSIDLASEIYKNKNKINVEKILNKNIGVGNRANNIKDYIVVLQHPVTTEYKDTKKNIKETIKSIYQLNFPTIWLWPNIDAGNDIISKEIRRFREKTNPKNISFVKNFSPEDFLKILIKKKLI